MILLSGDVGVKTTEKLIDAVRQAAKKKEIEGTEQVMPFLKKYIAEMLQDEGQRTRIGAKPTVILVVGVNGVGKTTTIGKLANYFHLFKYKVMLITDHADEYSFDDLQANTEGYRDSDIELQNVIMTANWLVGRDSEKLSEDEKESPAFYICSSGALAGKLYDESANMAQGAGGKKYGTLNGVKGVKLDLLKSEIAALMDNQVIPMVYSEGRVMAFNNTTLYNGDNTSMKEYPIVRVFDWVKKVLMNYVHEVALENWDPYNSPKNLKAKIQAFLNDYKGYGNLFQNYEIKEPTQDPITKRITCDISLTPFYSAKNFIIKVSADKKDKDAQMA